MAVIIKIGGSIAYNKDQLVNFHLVQNIMQKYSAKYGKNVLFVMGCGDLLHEITDKYRVNDPQAKSVHG